MKIMNCPLNGPRNISEFVWGGDVKAMPDPASASDREWTEYLFLEDNLAGEVLEWWLHAPSNFWFIARRDTVTDTIIETMTVDDFMARLAAAGRPGAAQSEANAAGDAP
jgi:sarcosine oxidase, subunit delta